MTSPPMGSSSEGVDDVFFGAEYSLLFQFFGYMRLIEVATRQFVTCERAKYRHIVSYRIFSAEFLLIRDPLLTLIQTFLL